MNDLLDVGYRMNDEVEQLDYHSHQEYEIYFFHAGSCRYLIHNQIYDLEPGDIILMDGLSLHKPNIHPQKEYIRSIVHFPPNMIQDVLHTLNSEYLLNPFQNLPYRFIQTGENQLSKELEKVIDQLVQVKRNNTHTQNTELTILLIQALIIVYQLSEKSHNNLTKKQSIKAQHAENIATYIQVNYMKELTVTSISKDLNLSPSYASRLFKEMTGFTIMEFVMGCRLNQAKYLLEMKPDQRIKDVAFESGFGSTAHFSRYFRANVGKTAHHYRRHRLKFMK